MISSPAQGLGLVLVLVTAVALLLVLRRLRAIPVRSLRSKLLGGVVPLGATAAYVYLAAPPYSVTILAGAFIVSLVLGTILGRSGGRPLKPDSRQRGISLAVWSIVFLLAAVSGLTAYGGLHALAAAAISAAAGFAFGGQVGVLLRPRSGGAGAAQAALAALFGLLVTVGPSVDVVSALGPPPEPCSFMDVTIWPGPILEDPGIQPGGDADAPSCTARFFYDTDESGFILVGELTVIRFQTEAAAQASVESAGTVFGDTAVDFGDGGIEVVYIEDGKPLYAAYFSVDNYVGWVKGQAYSDERIEQARAAARRLADLIEQALELAAATPAPAPTLPPTLAPPSGEPSAVPSAAPSPSPSAAPSAAPSTLVEPSSAPSAPVGPSPAPSAPVVPGQLDPTGILTALETFGASLTLGAPAEPQDVQNTVQGIGAGLAVIVAGLFLARFGGSAGTGRRAKGATMAVQPLDTDDAAMEQPGSEPAPAERIE